MEDISHGYIIETPSKLRCSSHECLRRVVPLP
jgi:hypothetical protein